MRRRPSLAVAIAILIVGLALSAAAALLLRADVRSHERREFAATAADVKETLVAELRRDTDFVATLRALETMQPHLSNTEFNRWYAQLEGDRRQVGNLATAVISVVPASELAAFQARRKSDPAFRALVGGNFEILPSGRRSRYCLLSAGRSQLALNPLVMVALHADWCTGVITGLAEVLESEADSGQFAVSPPRVGTVFIGAAVYRRGASLHSVAARKAAVIGWIFSSVDIPAVIRTALGIHRGLAVTLYHRDANRGLELAGAAGAAGAGTLIYRKAFDVEGTWVIEVRGVPAIAEIPADVQGVSLFVGGIVVSLLLSALVFMLMRSRQRALGLAAERTDQLRHQALHDALTGLPNRLLVLDRAEQMLARARRRRTPAVAIHIDLDGFKHIVDSYGHAAGDELLKIVAARLTGIVREADTAARVGGDEFVILTESPSLDAGPELVAERLLEVLRLPYSLSGKTAREVSITASIGIAFGMRESADELLRDADFALREAKAAGKDRYVLFESSMHTAAKDRGELEMDLAGALDRREMFLLYQPMFDLRSEEVVGFEALLRWGHATRGVLSPSEFIPIAEENGLVVPIGRWVLNAACRQAASWRHHGRRRVGISVNVSARQLDHDAFVEEVEHALVASGLDATALTLEVTETTLMRDTEQTAKRLELLKQLGVRVVVDDFGTGYSSLAYLRQFPVDALKIDKSFVAGIAADKESAALVHTLIALGKTLELETVAEGIEETGQLQALQREHCDYGQGFLFSKPLDPMSVEALLDGSRDRSEA